MTDLLDDVQIDHKEVFAEALNIYKDTTLDFVDCILVGRNHILKDVVFSFDKKLNKKLIIVEEKADAAEEQTDYES